MGILDIFRRKSDEGIPPDVGMENIEKDKIKDEIPDDIIDVDNSSDNENYDDEIPLPSKNVNQNRKQVLEKIKNEEELEEVAMPVKNYSGDNYTRKNFSQDKKSTLNESKMISDSHNNIEIEKIKAHMEEIKMRNEQINERLSRMNETIGELRAMGLSNEKKIADSTKDSDKVVDMFKEIKPNDLRIEYQKADIRLQKLEERIEASKQMVESVIKDFGNLRKESEAFLGTDGLVKLNEDVKKDLVNIQKISEKTRMYADKTKEIFLNIKSSFEESEKISDIVGSLNESFSVLKEEIEELKINHEDVVKRSDYIQFKKTFGNKISLLDSLISQIESLKEDNNKLSGLVENSLEISQRNSEDIGNIGLKVGDGNVKRVADYENQLADVLEIVETLTNQVSELRKRINTEGKKNIIQRISKNKNSNSISSESGEIKNYRSSPLKTSKNISRIRNKFEGLLKRVKKFSDKNKKGKKIVIKRKKNLKKSAERKLRKKVSRKTKEKKISKVPTKKRIKKFAGKKLKKIRRRDKS